MPTSSSPRTRPDAARAGVTLLELIVTITIVSVLFGLGIGAFRRLAPPERTAETRLKDALRRARLFARAEGAPATVVLRPAQGEVFATGLARAGNWHFEDPAGDGWPVDARHPEGEIVPDGVIGSCLALDAGATLVLDDLPASFTAPGFGLDVSLRPAGGARPMTLLERPGRWRLALDRDDALEVTLRLASAGPDDATEELRRTLGRVLPAGRWTRLAVVFDGRRLHVAINGLRVGQDTLLPAPRRLAPSPGAPLVSGQDAGAFRGQLDELVVSAALLGDRTPLPEEVRLEGPERVVHFDGRGHLDGAWHDGPVVLSFVHGEPRRRTWLEVGVLGGVTTASEDAGTPPSEERP